MVACETLGNLCRCTGYRPLAAIARQGCTAEPLLLSPPPIPAANTQLAWSDGGLTWHHPLTLAQLKPLLATPGARLVHGATEVFVERRLRGAGAACGRSLIYTGAIAELNRVTLTPSALSIGAGVSLERLRQVINECLQWDQQRTGPWGAMVGEALRWFAGRQVRAQASWAGNLATASPISDLNPCWMVLDASVSSLNSHGNDEETLRVASFFRGYRQTALKPGSLLVALHLPLLQWAGWHGVFLKQAKRPHDDIALVNLALLYRRDERGEKEEKEEKEEKGGKEVEGGMIVGARAAYGGVGPMTRLFELPSPFPQADAMRMAKWLMDQVKMGHDAPGAMVVYRLTLVGSLFLKALSSPHRESKSLAEETHQEDNGGVPHLAGLHHATGEAVYVDDLAPLAGELHAVPLLSTQANARVWINLDEALQQPGIVSWIDGENVPAQRFFGPVQADEPLFGAEGREGVTLCAGQLLGLLVGETEAAVRAALERVTVRYEPLGPPLLTIEQAMAANSFYPFERSLDRHHGEEEEEGGGEEEALVWVEGEVRMDGQEHFYLECNAVRVEPSQDPCNRLQLWCSSQNPAEVQQWAADACGLAYAQVHCQVPRLGGGFGGKETRSQLLSTAVAVAAHQLGRPVRCALQRSEDMAMTGQRHPFLARYRVAFSKGGLLKEQQVQLWSNGGCSLDLSLGVLERALAHLDNCYYCPVVHYRGRICRTHLPSNTAFRGFGGPQGMFVMETIMDQGATALGLDPTLLRELNLYQPNHRTPFKMVISPTGEDPLRTLWARMKPEYQTELAKVQAFNLQHSTLKRGVAMVPTKFGIAFGARHLNQVSLGFMFLLGRCHG